MATVKQSGRADSNDDSSPPRKANIEVNRCTILAKRSETLPISPPNRVGEVPPTPAPSPPLFHLPRVSTIRRGSVSPQPQAISLQRLATVYSKSLPLRFCVHQGFYGQNEDLELCVGDPYNVYCTKQSHTAVIDDMQGNSYYVPFGSALKFTLFPPDTKFTDRELKCGQEFVSLSDVIALKTLPNVLAVTRHGRVGFGDKQTLEQNEILLVLGLHKPKSSSRKGLRVLSVGTKKERLLTLDCTASFSTKPSMVAMHIPDILKHFSDFLPCTASVYLHDDYASQLRDQFVTEFLSQPVRIMQGSQLVTSLLVSPAVGNSKGLLEIPVGNNLQEVEMTLVSSHETELRALRMQTVSTLATFSPSKTKLLSNKPSSRIYNIQSMLHTTVRQGAETMGVRFETAILDDGVVLQGPSYYNPMLDDMEVHFPTENVENFYESLRDYDHSNVPNEELPHAAKNLRRMQTCRPTAKHQLPLPPTVQSFRRPLSASTAKSRLFSGRLARSMDTLLHTGVSASATGNIHPPDPASFLEAQSRKFEYSKNQSLELSKQRPQHRPPTKLEIPPPHMLPTEDADPAYISPIVTDKSSRQIAFDGQHDDVSSMYARLKPVDHQTSKVFNEVQSKLGQSMTEIQKELKSVRDEITTLKAKFLTVQSNDSDSSVDQNGQEMTEQMQVRNRQFLASLSTAQVQQLLVAMKLEQYIEMFAQECIDGGVLQELSDDLLEEDLGITSKLHRLRLRRVINGLHSAKDILSSNLQ